MSSALLERSRAKPISILEFSLTSPAGKTTEMSMESPISKFRRSPKKDLLESLSRQSPSKPYPKLLAPAVLLSLPHLKEEINFRIN